VNYDQIRQAKEKLCQSQIHFRSASRPNSSNGRGVLGRLEGDHAFLIAARQQVANRPTICSAPSVASRPQTLELNAPLYSPLKHYEGVKNQWIGTEPWH
jgi:hypothetical protein